MILGRAETEEMVRRHLMVYARSSWVIRVSVRALAGVEHGDPHHVDFDIKELNYRIGLVDSEQELPIMNYATYICRSLSHTTQYYCITAIGVRHGKPLCDRLIYYVSTPRSKWQLCVRP